MNRTRKIITELKFKHYITATFVCVLLLISKTDSFAQSDTVDVGRQYDLDTIKFLNTYQKNVSLLHSDTLLVQIEGKHYRIPYRVTLKSVDVADNTPKRFTISSMALRDYPDFSRRLKNIFDNPRERLYTYYSPKDLEKAPGLVRIHDVDFNFNKLDPEMKSFLVNFRDTRGKSGNRNNLD